MLLLKALNNCSLCWKTSLKTELDAPYFLRLNDHVEHAYEKSTVFPSRDDLFNCLSAAPLKKVRVVIVAKIHTTAKVKQTVWRLA